MLLTVGYKKSKKQTHVWKLDCCLIVIYSPSASPPTLAKKEKTQFAFENKLPCKPFCGNGESSRITTAATMDTEADSADDDDDDNTSSSDSLEQMEAQCCPEPPKGRSFKEGSACALCTEDFQGGQPVVQSNNPSCGHVHHKKCIDQWLRFQNTCPVCNQAYVLQTV